MPVRSVLKRTRTTVRHGFNSFKNTRQVGCESGLERDLALLLEFSPKVTAFEEQPRKFVIPSAPKSFFVIPDFSVTLWTGEIVIAEVKYKKKAIELAEKHELVAKHLITEGLRYLVLTEEHIRFNQIVLDNGQYLKGFKSPVYRGVEELAQFIPRKALTLRELIEKIGDETIAMQLIAHQLIFHDFAKKLTLESQLRPIRPNDFDFMSPWLF